MEKKYEIEAVVTMLIIMSPLIIGYTIIFFQLAKHTILSLLGKD